MKKAMGMFAALILALGMSGIAYAHWSKIITISGTVTTGNFHLYPTGSIEVVEPTDKVVAQVSCVVDNKTNTVTYTVDNAFPCLKVKGRFDVHNDGAIPAKLKNVSFTPDSKLAVNIIHLPGPEAKIEIEQYGLSPTENKIAEGKLTFSTDPPIDGQIDADEEAYVDFEIHFTENLPQENTYTFSVTLEFWNWNEVP